MRFNMTKMVIFLLVSGKASHIEQLLNKSVQFQVKMRFDYSHFSDIFAFKRGKKSNKTIRKYVEQKSHFITNFINCTFWL